jgi:chromosome segregation ATPase
MGWVSFLEDKLERLNSDLDQIRRSRKTRDPKLKKQSTSDAERHLYALMGVCESFMRDIHKHLELATDPEVELADQLLTVKSENEILRGQLKTLNQTQTRLAELTHKCGRLQKDFDQANGRAGKYYAQLEELNRRYKHLEKEHVRLKRGKGLH